MKQIFISECICLSLQRFEQFCLLEDNGLWTSQKISICKSHSWPTSITLWLSHLQAILFCVFFITSSVHRRWQRCLQPEATVEQQEEQPVWKRRKVRKIFYNLLGKQHIFMAWICGFGHLEEVTLQSADQSDGGLRKEPEEKSEVHLEIYFCTLFCQAESRLEGKVQPWQRSGGRWRRRGSWRGTRRAARRRQSNSPSTGWGWPEIQLLNPHC